MKRNRTGLLLLLFLIASIFSSNAVWADSVANWSTGIPMPTARIGAASGVVNGKIFILGGSNTVFPPPAGTMAVVEAFDPLSFSWTSMTPMIVPRFAGGDATLGTIIYIAGGTAVGGPIAGGPNYQNTVLAYDTATGSSSIIGYLQVARFRTAAGIIGEKLYVAGGSGGASGAALDSIEEYNLVTNTSVVKATLPVPTDLPAAVAFGGKLYIIGGFDASGNPINSCLEYDPATNTLLPKNPMPMARGGMGGAVVFNNKIYVLGGAVNPGPPPITTFSEIQEYDPLSDTWQLAGTLPTVRWGFAAEVSDALPDRLFLIGGSDNAQALTLNEAGVFAPGTPVTITTPSLAAGTSGSSYGQSLSATGGLTPYSWSVESGVLPPGLSLNGSTGTISGTPSASGSWTFSIQVRDSATSSDSRSYSLVVYDPLVITTASLPEGIVGGTYNATVTGAGGHPPYSWSLSGSLPPGLSLDGLGTISGLPSAAGTFSFTILAMDGNSWVSKPFSITIYQALSITTTSLPFGTNGTAYAQTLAATGGKTPYTWSLSSGALPNGLSLNTATGLLSGTPSVAGTFTFTVRVSDANSNSGQKVLSITIYDPLAITTSSLPYVRAGFYYSQVITASGGKTPYTWSVISGSLPSGFALNGSTGEISGGTWTAGTYNFTVQVTDVNSTVTSKALSITIYDQVGITTKSLPYGRLGVAYNQTLVATGKAPFTWTITPGSLPGGLSLNSSTGAITGTPTQEGNFEFDLTVTDDLHESVTQDMVAKIVTDKVWIYDAGTRVNGDHAYSSAQGTAVDGSGNVYVAGRSGADGAYDCLVIKYGPSGNVLWTKTYDGGGDDEAYNVALDASGNVYVGGQSQVGAPTITSF